MLKSQNKIKKSQKNNIKGEVRGAFTVDPLVPYVKKNFSLLDTSWSKRPTKPTMECS